MFEYFLLKIVYTLTQNSLDIALLIAYFMLIFVIQSYI